MKFENVCVIPAPIEKLWAYLTDIPSVARCLPGVEEASPQPDGTYTGVIALKVGMVKLRLKGRITIEQMDPQQRVASMRVQAADERISGMIQGVLSMRLEEVGPLESRLIAGTDVNLFGKIGEFGQPMIKKKADQMMAEFAANVADMMAPESSRKRGAQGSILGLSGDPS
jgi:carbon monoxide dehydrogenase subunit G